MEDEGSRVEDSRLGWDGEESPLRQSVGAVSETAARLTILSGGAQSQQL